MEEAVTIKDIRIYFQNRISTRHQFAIKVCTPPDISITNNLTANRFCKRWESNQPIDLPLPPNHTISIQILKFKGSLLKRTLCEGTIETQCLPQSLSDQLKISLTNNGQVVGWLYCQFLRGREPKSQTQHFLHMHRITTSFLDMRDEECTVTIYLNNVLIFVRDIHLKLRKRTLFPSIKQTVKKSDVLAFEISSKRQKGKLNSFIIDNLESGQTSVLQSWMRNKLGNKMGDFELEYFLENFFLPNKRPNFSSTYDDKIRGTRNQETLTNKQKEDLRLSINIQTLTNIGSTKGERTTNPLLNRVIHGARKRRHLVYCPETHPEIKKRTNLNQIVEDLSGSQL